MPDTRYDWKGDPVVGGDRDLPVVDGVAFDRAAATASIFEWAGGDDFDPAKARRGFVLYDDGDPALRGSYHLPFARYENGRLEAVGNGIRNAKSRVEQYEPPLSSEVHDRAVAFLNSYMDQLHGDEAEDAAPEPDGRVQIGAYRVPILRGPAAAARAVAPADMAAIMHHHAFDPTVFGERSPFTFPAVISSDLVDSYFTHMSDRTLRNYAADAQAGVAVQNSHRDDELPLGRSFRGEYFTDLAGRSDGPDAGASITVGRSLRALLNSDPLTGVAPLEDPTEPDPVTGLVPAGSEPGTGNGPRGTIPGANSVVIADAYIMPGQRLGAVATDDAIMGIRAGTINDVSVGFYGGNFICDICGRDLWDWDCPHIPGMSYQAREDGGKYSGTRVATASVEDAHLAEFSLVYKGASPGAAIIKGRQLSDAGLLQEKAARTLERRYRIRLRAAAFRVVVPATVGRAEEGTMPKTVAELEAELAAHEATRAATATERDQARQAHQAAEQAAQRHQAAVARVTQALAEAGVAVPADGDPAEGVRTVVSELQAARPLAETGRTYRNDLIAETLKQGVRAFGAPFSQDTMRAVLERSTLDEIKHMRTVWTEQADKVFGTGGRQTVEDQARNDGTRTSTVPSYLYRA